MNKQKHIICKTIEKKDRQDRLLIFLSGILATEWILGLLQAATGTLAGHFTDFTVTGILNRAWEYWNTQYPAVHSVIETWNNKFLDSGTAILAGLSATILIGILFFFLLKEERQGIIFLFSLPIAIVQMLLPNEKNYFVAVYFITLFTAYLIIENEKSVIKQKSSQKKVVLIALFSVVLIFLAGSSEVWNSVQKPFCKNIAYIIDTKIEELRYGSENGGMTGGDFSELAGLQITDAEVLELTMTEPESYYLKGYTGHDYTGYGFKPLDEESVNSAGNDLFYWLEKKEFRPETMLSRSADLTGLTDQTEDINVMTVSHKDGLRQYFFLPYEMEQLEGYGYRLPDGDLRTRGLQGQEKYRVTVREGLLPQYRTLITCLSGVTDETVQDYLQLEGNYRDFVYENYLQLPKETEDAIKRVFPEKSTQTGTTQNTVGQVKTFILQTLSQFTYDESVTYQKEQGDFVKLFLEEQTGYAVQFSTAAVMAFRYYGIPARWAEGYLVTDAMAENVSPGEVIPVTAENYHCWVEYYEDGIGWIPFETTPPYIGLMESGEALQIIGSHEETEAPDTMQEPEVPEQKLNTTEVEVNRFMTILLLVLLLLLIAVICTLARTVLRKKKIGVYRKKDFYDADRKRAILAIMSYIKYWEKKHQIPDELQLQRHGVEQIYLEARYSNHRISEKSYREVVNFFTMFKKRKRVRY